MFFPVRCHVSFCLQEFSNSMCAAELWQAICVGIISVWSYVFAKDCRCLCSTVQLLKAAWILKSCSRDKESMKKIQLTGWFCLLQIDGLAGCHRGIPICKQSWGSRGMVWVPRAVTLLGAPGVTSVWPHHQGLRQRWALQLPDWMEGVGVMDHNPTDSCFQENHRNRNCCWEIAAKYRKCKVLCLWQSPHENFNQLLRN